jgi:phosphoesterase RecJ-like protein
MGKNATMMCDDNVPARFHYLTNANQAQRPKDVADHYDLIIAVDCGDELRMGQSFSTLPEPKPPIVNIDHHITNTEFGEINLIVGTAVSTTEILFDFFRKTNVTLTEDIAMSLLTGLVTDTLGFRTDGVSSKTLSIAAALMDAGANLPLVTAQGLSMKKLSTVELWRHGLGNMKLEKGLIWSTISKEQRQAAHFTGASSNGLTNLLADVDQAAIGVVLMEMENGDIRVGFRCRPPYSVAEVALNLGGGGHALAAGCTMDGPLDKAEALVVAMCKEAIQQQEENLN